MRPAPRTLSFYLLALCALATAVVGPLDGGAAPLATSQGSRPHVVIFIADDHSRDDCTPYGSRDVRTPHLQRLADDGMRFNRAYVASPACGPNRTSMLTGLMPARTGAEYNHHPPRPGLKELTRYLHETGYETASFGKVSHPTFRKFFPFDHENREVIKATLPVAALDAYLAGRNSPRPLVLLVGSTATHTPWPKHSSYDPATIEVPPNHVDTPETRQARALYYEAISQTDTQFGETRERVRKHLGENTLLIYTSDHGAALPFGKWGLYEQGIRIPFIAQWPGVIAAGTQTDALVSWVDVLPTLIEVAGGTPPTDIDGKSFAAVLRHPSLRHRDEIFTTHDGDGVNGSVNHYPMRAVCDARFKYIRNLHPTWAYTTHIEQSSGVHTGLDFWLSWRKAAESDPIAATVIRRYHAREVEELYDLRTDPYELNNLATTPAYGRVRTQLRAKLDQWMTQQGDRAQPPANSIIRLLANPADWAPAKFSPPQ